MDLGNAPRTQRDQVGSSKEAKNRDIRTEKLLELALFIRRDKDLKTESYLFFTLLMSPILGDGRMW